jgi:hypothetical protein
MKVGLALRANPPAPSGARENSKPGSIPNKEFLAYCGWTLEGQIPQTHEILHRSLFPSDACRALK